MAPGKALDLETARPNARQAMLEAAQGILRSEGFAALSTRRVAVQAGVPLSQIHYHFGSKEGLILALLDHLDRPTLTRQEQMFERDTPLSERWSQACDYLDVDIESGYVRLLQECVALGWSNPTVAEKVRALLDRWVQLLTEVAEEAEAKFGPFGPFTAAEVVELIGLSFMGAESALLLGVDEERRPIRSALRKVGLLIELMEKNGRKQHDTRTLSR